MILIQEPPLQVLPTLAARIGLNEAIFLQQLHYWLQRSTTEAMGCKWVYNTASQWQEQFPFWSTSTIDRIVKSLKDQRLITTVQLRKKEYDHTNYFTICYSSDLLIDVIDSVKMRESDTPKLRESSIHRLTTDKTTSALIGASNLVEQGIDEQVARDWLAIRKAKKAPLTQTAWKGIVSEASKAGISIQDAVRISAERNWVGFKAAWHTEEQKQAPVRNYL